MDNLQFLTTLIEETHENLAEIEDAVLTLDIANPDPEKINQIFRSVHTIKGNAAIFKLETIGKLMHVGESFLDEVRQGNKRLDTPQLELLLKISDVIKSALADIQQQRPIDEAAITALTSEFQSKSMAVESKVWHVTIQPKDSLFKKNLDPLPGFQMLSSEAILSNIQMLDKNLVDFEPFDPLKCYLGWEFDISGDISQKRILEILTWILDENDINIVELDKKEKKKEIPGAKPKSQEILTADKNERTRQDSLIATTKAGQKALPPLPEERLLRGTSLRVSTEKIDTIMNAVGELVIIESMLKDAIKKIDPKQSGILEEPMDLLDTNFRYLQNNILRIRMVPIDFAINRFPRMVFEMSNKLGKRVNFVVEGGQTEMDKNMIEKISDPLLHLIRNAIDHGIESPEERERKGKNKTGTIQFIAYQEGDSITIEIHDDGAGIDPEKIKALAVKQGLIQPHESPRADELYNLLFRPGFSTAKAVTEYSGRGVGLDVVEKNIRALGGSVLVESIPGAGSHFKLKLPLTLAIMECQLIRVCNQIYIIPLISIAEMFEIDLNNIREENDKVYYQYLDQKIPLVVLEQVLHEDTTGNQLKHKIVVIVQSNGRNTALVCDELLIQQPIVIKTLEDNFCRVPGIVGASIMGDGGIGLILDIKEILDIADHRDIRPIAVDQFFHRKFLLTEISGKNSQPKQVTPTEKNAQYLCFSLGKYEYAINMKQIKEINLSKRAEYLPFSPPYIVGIINLRGSIIPVIDLGLFFNIKSSLSKEKGILVVVTLEKEGLEKTIGLMVDAITDTQTINPQDINPIPKTGRLMLSHYIQGLVYINQRIITLLQIQNLVDTTR